MNNKKITSNLLIFISNNLLRVIYIFQSVTFLLIYNHCKLIHVFIEHHPFNVISLCDALIIHLG